MSRVAKGLSLVAGGAAFAQFRPAGHRALPSEADEPWRLPEPIAPTLSELFAAHARDAGWASFLLAQIDPAKPILWIQERMAILESGRVYPPGLGASGLGGRVPDLIHVEARDARDSLWAMEEGLRCAGLSAVIGELWGDPKSLDFTATRRLAVAAERSGVPCWLVRLSGAANLSGARMRWRIASAPSLPHPFDARAPGMPAWDAELFRARSMTPGRWSIAGDAGAFHLVAGACDRALGEGERLRA